MSSAGRLIAPLLAAALGAQCGAAREEVSLNGAWLARPMASLLRRPW